MAALERFGYGAGFILEDIKEKREEILEYIDVLISGPFIEAQKDLTLLWRGSSNQIITKF